MVASCPDDADPFHLDAGAPAIERIARGVRAVVAYGVGPRIAWFGSRTKNLL